MARNVQVNLINPMYLYWEMRTHSRHQVLHPNSVMKTVSFFTECSSTSESGLSLDICTQKNLRQSPAQQFHGQGSFNRESDEIYQFIRCLPAPLSCTVIWSFWVRYLTIHWFYLICKQWVDSRIHSHMMVVILHLNCLPFLPSGLRYSQEPLVKIFFLEMLC